MPTIEGGLINTFPGVPVAGNDEVQTLTITGTPTGGTFRLRFGSAKTAAIAYNASAATVAAALNALSTLGAGAVAGGGGALPGTPVTITFSGANVAKRDQPLIVAENVALTGGTTPDAAVTETTPGVLRVGIGTPKGGLLTDNVNGILYINTGTPEAPVWTKVGTQT